MHQSSPQSLLLDRVTLLGEGIFSCEVSSLPTFDTKFGWEKVVVGRVPSSLPQMSNIGAKKLSRGDILKINCTSFGSHPPPNITWFINGKLALKYDVSMEREYLNRSQIGDTLLNRWDLTSEISIPVEPDLFSVGTDTSRIKVKCLVTLYDLYYKSNEISVETPGLSDRKRSEKKARPKKTAESKLRSEPITSFSSPTRSASLCNKSFNSLILIQTFLWGINLSLMNISF